MARAHAPLIPVPHDDVQELTGGWTSVVTRVGPTVRRRPPTSSDRRFVESLLCELEERGFDPAPRFLGVDEQDRQVLSYIDGFVPSSPTPPPPGVGDEGSVVAAIGILRRLHDLTERADGLVSLHGDVAPRNTVYRDGGNGFRPFALIDWDQAHVGERVYDVAYATWQILDLGAPWVRMYPQEAARRFALMADAYGLVASDRERLVDAVLECLDRGWRGIVDRSATDLTMRRLVALGVPAAVRANAEWMMANRRHFDRALERSGG